MSKAMTATCALTDEMKTFMKSVTLKYLNREVSHLDIILHDDLYGELNDSLPKLCTTPAEKFVEAWMSNIAIEFATSDARKQKLRANASLSLQVSEHEDEGVGGLMMLGMEVDGGEGEGEGGLMLEGEGIVDGGEGGGLMLEGEGIVEGTDLRCEENISDGEEDCLPWGDAAAWWVKQLDDELSQEEDSTVSQLVKTMPIVSEVSVVWCDGKVVDKRRGVPDDAPHSSFGSWSFTAQMLSSNISKRVSLNMCGDGTLTAVIDSNGRFVPSIYGQFYSPLVNVNADEGPVGIITMDSDCVSPARFSRHPCVVVDGQQTCCNFPHLTLKFNVHLSLIHI